MRCLRRSLLHLNRYPARSRDAGEGNLRGLTARVAKPGYLRGMPALSITAFHLAMSDFNFAISSSGVLALAITPTFANFSFTSGNASTSRIALFIVSMISFGVPLGANTAFQDVTS